MHFADKICSLGAKVWKLTVLFFVLFFLMEVKDGLSAIINTHTLTPVLQKVEMVQE